MIKSLTSLHLAELLSRCQPSCHSTSPPPLFSLIESHGTRADVLLLFMASGMPHRRYFQNLCLNRFQSHDQVCCFNIRQRICLKVRIAGHRSHHGAIRYESGEHFGRFSVSFSLCTSQTTLPFVRWLSRGITSLRELKGKHR